MMTHHEYRQSPPIHEIVVVTCDTCGSDVFRGQVTSHGAIARKKQEHERRSRVAAEMWDWGSER